MLYNIFESVQKFNSSHHVNFSLKLSDDILELVVNHNHALTILRIGQDLVANGSRSGEVYRGCDVGCCEFHNVWERPGQRNRTFISNHKNFISLSVIFNHCFDFSYDIGVRATTKTLVGGKGNQESFFNVDRSLLFMQIALAGNDLGNGAHSIRSGAFQPGNILLHLGCCYHLHSLRDFLDRLNGLHAEFDDLQTFCSKGKVALEEQRRYTWGPVDKHGLINKNYELWTGKSHKNSI